MVGIEMKKMANEFFTLQNTPYVDKSQLKCSPNTIITLQWYYTK